MATRSTIAVQHLDGTISQTYCHWDGYPGHVGTILVRYYNQYALAAALVSGGSISSLGADFAQTEYYSRDRGEDYGTEAVEFASFDDYQSNYLRQEFNYLWVNGQWMVSADRGDEQLVPVADLIR